jgi:NTE family protein
MREFQNSKDRPYIHLVDGGVADNIGVRAILETLEAMGASAAGRADTGFASIRRIVVIVVNARSAPKTDWDRHENPPGMISQLLQSSGVPIDRYSFETVELLKDRQEIYGWRREIQILRARMAGATEAEADASVPLPKLSIYTMEVSFEDIQDLDERAYFMNLPTSFVLAKESVDRLRDVAGRLLRESKDYQSMLRDLGGSPQQQ